MSSNINKQRMTETDARYYRTRLRLRKDGLMNFIDNEIRDGNGKLDHTMIGVARKHLILAFKMLEGASYKVKSQKL